MRVSIVFVVLLALITTGMLVTKKLMPDDGGVHISSISPGGNYHIEINGETTPKDALPGQSYLQQVKLEASRGNEKIYTDDEFYRGDPYEMSFLQAYPTYNWLNNSIFKLGESALNQPYQDEITVRNSTGENLDFVIVSYGKYEEFLIFDLAPGQSHHLNVSPNFEQQWPVSSVGYQAHVNGRTIYGNDGKDSRKPADGPLKFVLDIKNNPSK